MSKPFSKIKFKREAALTAEQMREVDRVAVEELNLQILQMMEIAAMQMATLARSILQNLANKKVLVLAGKGNNGGDAIACARYLYNWGAIPTIIVPSRLNKNASRQLAPVERMGIDVQSELPAKRRYSAIIDGILGYSVKGEVREPFRGWISAINALNIPIFSYDIPSGLNPDNGSIQGVCVKAAYTLTLAYPKRGLFRGKAGVCVGDLYLADIGIPNIVYDMVRHKYPRVEYIAPFTQASLVRIDDRDLAC